MKRLSIAMIAHNEENNLGSALESVTWADQIVVVDCQSTDASAQIAAHYGAEVYHEPNRESLNVNKNIAINHCSGDWVLVLDADESIPDLLAGEIRSVINTNKHDGYLIPRRNHILGRFLKHGAQYPDYQLRLFKRNKGKFAEKHVHERLHVTGTTGKLTEPFDHYPYPNLTSMMNKAHFYADYESTYLFASGRKVSGWGLLMRAFIKPTIRFFNRYFIKRGFLDGVPGLVVAYFDAWNQVTRWFGLWDKQRREDNTPGAER